jgi:hypothetical protein
LATSDHAEKLHRQNPRFDSAKFMKAELNEGKQPETDTVPFITDSDKPFDGPYTKTPSKQLKTNLVQYTHQCPVQEIWPKLQ